MNKLRIFWGLISCVLFAGFVFCESQAEASRCMGLSFITEEQATEMAKNPIELGNIVLLEDMLTAYDVSDREIFLPCNVNEESRFCDLEGRLTSALPEYELYFLWEDAFNILQDAISYGCKFTLYAIDSNGNYSTYDVIFTTIPVLEMHGECIAIDERSREIFQGDLTVWESKAKETERLRVQSSSLEWHVRGYSSMSFQKKSLRLSLKEKSGNNNKLSIAGFESDDDYILNPMWFDDLKVREKLAMDIWNEMAVERGSNLKMSGGEYCELIINGEYQGLRLLQNKIEKGYLKLQEEDILLKGKNVNVGTKKPPEEVYEVVYSKQTEEVTYRTISDFFYEKDFSNVNLDSWIDMQLLLLFGNMLDNECYKNIYYVIEYDDGKESMSFIPWDTDMSFGVYWVEGSNFQYVPESVENVTWRLEYEELCEQYPDLKEKMAKRWSELRKTVLKEEHIIGKIQGYRGCLGASGAVQRDFNVLGWYSWGDKDTEENLYIYIERRLEILDGLFG